jgi:hypothetical protein
MMDGISCRVGYCGFGQPRSGLVRSINAWNFLISDGTLTESCAPFTTDWDSEVRAACVAPRMPTTPGEPAGARARAPQAAPCRRECVSPAEEPREYFASADAPRVLSAQDDYRTVRCAAYIVCARALYMYIFTHWCVGHVPCACMYVYL